jgi:hypothetical protein
MFEVEARGLVTVLEFSTDTGLLLHPTRATTSASPAKTFSHFAEMFEFVFTGHLFRKEIWPPRRHHPEGITFEE